MAIETQPTIGYEYGRMLFRPSLQLTLRVLNEIYNPEFYESLVVQEKLRVATDKIALTRAAGTKDMVKGLILGDKRTHEVFKKPGPRDGANVPIVGISHHVDRAGTGKFSTFGRGIGFQFKLNTEYGDALEDLTTPARNARQQQIDPELQARLEAQRRSLGLFIHPQNLSPNIQTLAQLEAVETTLNTRIRTLGSEAFARGPVDFVPVASVR